MIAVISCSETYLLSSGLADCFADVMADYKADWLSHCHSLSLSLAGLWQDYGNHMPVRTAAIIISMYSYSRGVKESKGCQSERQRVACLDICFPDREITEYCLKLLSSSTTSAFPLPEQDFFFILPLLLPQVIRKLQQQSAAVQREVHTHRRPDNDNDRHGSIRVNRRLNSVLVHRWRPVVHFHGKWTGSHGLKSVM